jgi:hypothetical protein
MPKGPLQKEWNEAHKPPFKSEGIQVPIHKLN